MKPDLDDISGQQTTGHEWNGIKELNTPIPKAFRIWLWLSIAICVPYWILYPGWPYVTGYTEGLLRYSSRTAVNEAVDEGKAQRAEAFSPFETQDVSTLAQNPDLRGQFEQSIGVLYRDNCAACHGRDLIGQDGFPQPDRHSLALVRLSGRN